MDRLMDVAAGVTHPALASFMHPGDGTGLLAALHAIMAQEEEPVGWAMLFESAQVTAEERRTLRQYLLQVLSHH